MYIAFYKNPKTIFEKLVKFFTKSSIVHCELVTVKLNNRFYGYTSQPGLGVVCGWTDYDPNDWEFIKIDFSIRKVNEFYEQTENKGYDYLGVLGFVLHTHQDPNRYFCSEWCAEILGIEKPWTISPTMLYDMYKDKNEI